MQTEIQTEAAGRRYRPGALARPRGLRVVAVLAAVAVTLAASPAAAQSASTTTTTTLFNGTTTTTLFEPVDVTGGGRFEGSFPKGSFDVYSFELTEPRVLAAETSNGFGGCPGDTLVELREGGFGGNCGGSYGDNKPCLAFDDDSGLSLCSRLVHRILAPGTYWIRVSAYGGAKLNRYFLQVDFVDRQCGNGQMELTEECDDGGTAGGDCCDSDCFLDAQSSPCSDGVFCNGPDTCDAGGHCSKHLGNPCPGADGDSNCSETCDETAGNCAGKDANGSACTDGLFCTGTESCQDGACSQHSGDPCSGPDGDGNCSETCNEAADNCAGKDANGSPCDDGLFCNGADTCSGGTCSQHSGNPCAGADGDGNCSESCSEAADTCAGADPDGSPCDDGLGCNGLDTCQGGACSAHAGSSCAGADGDSDCSESCSDSGPGCANPDPEGAVCDDGIFCNGPDRCSGGSCSVHLGNPCEGADGDGNCAESCNEAGDACNAPDEDGSACDNGLFCDGADSCASGACSVHAGSPCAGADGDGDCAESCNEAGDACNAGDPAGSACDDGLYCNGADTCASGACSVHAGSPCAEADGDGDCAESCNEAGDTCDADDPAGSACDDGDSCTTASACDGSGTCGGTTPLDCDDADECTTDSCVGGAAPCSHVPVPGCPALLCGDVNQDGAVKASDALAALRTAVGTADCNGETCVCDVDGSGKVTASDALAVLKTAVGTATTLNCKC